MCLFVCHMVGRQRGMRVGGRGLLFDLVASKWGRPSKAGHQHRDQTCLSRSNHPQGHRRTRVKPPAGRKSMHMSLQAALVNTGFPLRCESDLQLQALSLVLSTTKKKKEITGLKSKMHRAHWSSLDLFEKTKNKTQALLLFIQLYMCVIHHYCLQLASSKW